MRCMHNPTSDTGNGPDTLPSPGPRAMSIRKAFFSSTEVVPARDAIGRVSADTLSAYPPGIPNLMAGEIVTSEAIEFLQSTARAPFGHVRGVKSLWNKLVPIWDDRTFYDFIARFYRAFGSVLEVVLLPP